jgi:3-phenylpropionate/trans-cinnamate dioxygenase ferredoxin subunit/anthranilate 1,2-dioxygenase ferredoxin subunit
MALQLGHADDFEDGAVYSFDLDGADVAVVKLRGRFYAFSNRCTHWGEPLTNGYVTSAGRIVCLFHDSAFDMRSGAALEGPAPEDLLVYKVWQEDGLVFLTNAD